MWLTKPSAVVSRASLALTWLLITEFSALRLSWSRVLRSEQANLSVLYNCTSVSSTLFSFVSFSFSAAICTDFCSISILFLSTSSFIRWKFSISSSVSSLIDFRSSMRSFNCSIWSLYWNSFRSRSSLNPHSDVFSSITVS